LSRFHLLTGLLLLGMGVGCKAQPATPAQNEEMIRRIETVVRAQYGIPSDIVIVLGARKPSQLAGYDSLQVTMQKSGQSQVVDFLISTDNKTLAHLETYSLTDYPLFDLTNRPVRGNPAAKVTVINYDDLECPYCAQMHHSLFPATLNRYKDTVRFIYKGNPLVSIHPWAMHAAVDSNCLAEQGGEAYWAYVDYIHSHANEVNGEDRDLTKSFERLDLIARQHATLNKLDEARLNACMAKQDESAVRATMKEAETLRVEGAPALFVNGVRVEGAIPQAEIWKVLDKVLRAEGVTPPAAVPAPAAPASAMPSQAKPEPPGN